VHYGSECIQASPGKVHAKRGTKGVLSNKEGNYKEVYASPWIPLSKSYRNKECHSQLGSFRKRLD
jgi:hypothetical protein